MPTKPKRPCSYPNCPKLTDGRFCDKHQKEENKRYEKYDRNPAVRRRYGRVWKRVRDSYVREHPYCELCFGNGLMVQVEEVHHKKPLSEGGTHARNNLISLCKSCHARIHATNGSRWNKKKATQKEYLIKYYQYLVCCKECDELPSCYQ
ncbi:5-methylcytosine-specific restriction protein A [Streptococcus gallinaceus]|uniref:HNH endonuclease n=1 Tax=Streptococcus gallinaceus TaxID=165758 RepID=UPI0029FB5784|nr:5-methylcytosine-specific restriction protein A [Streptococcus gallinaceus]MCP1769321.1 5-methylcytosine-specific restriction protein A [Streptococcus gallinaceus]